MGDLEKRLGAQGASKLELAAIGIPIAPGFVFEASKLDSLPDHVFQEILTIGIPSIEAETGKKFGDAVQPLLLKVSLLPDIALESTVEITHLGLNDQTVAAFANRDGEKQAYGTYRQFIVELATRYLGHEGKDFKPMADEASTTDNKALCASYLSKTVPDFPQDREQQLRIVLDGMLNRFYADRLNRDIALSLVVQYLPTGGPDLPCFFGSFDTRNIDTGESGIHRDFVFDESLLESIQRRSGELSSNDILAKFGDIASILEKYFLDIFQVEFALEQGKVWITGLKEVDCMSIPAKLRILSDFLYNGLISEKLYVESVSPNELNSLLFPVVDHDSVDRITQPQEGISGSLGAAWGRVFFSSEKLMAAYWKARSEGKNTHLVLLKRNTVGEDVSAVEVSQGVVTSEGGYTSHAPIIARYLGKPAVIYPDIVFAEDHVRIGVHKIKEGQTISLEAAESTGPAIFLGKARLEYPDLNSRSLREFLSVAKKYTAGIRILANADNPKEAIQAKKFGADGVGLCRTEHMFLRKERIYLFRELIVAKTSREKQAVLGKLRRVLESDFGKLFVIMEGKPVSIRLMDAPLHEFLPGNETEMKKTLDHLAARSVPQTRDSIRRHFDRLKEFNPMLGHRGCRVGISAPEIYETQIAAILEAALHVNSKQGMTVFPEIIVPFVMSEREMFLIRNGETVRGRSIKGANGIVRELLEKYNLKKLPFEFKVGTMIELPAAALLAGDIARQSEFFSIGTNDLTQTTLGLSRDDVNSFMTAYTEVGIWEKDPFRYLADPVKELIHFAVKNGRQVRPDLHIGICGEHGSEPDVIKYCLDIGMDFISCSPYAIPVAILTTAQYNISLK